MKQALGDLLARYGFLPDLGYGRIVYRDEHDRRALSHVLPTRTGVVLLQPDNRLMVLTRLQAGHLRGCLRHATHVVDPLPGDVPLPDGVWLAA